MQLGCRFIAGDERVKKGSRLHGSAAPVPSSSSSKSVSGSVAQTDGALAPSTGGNVQPGGVPELLSD